MDMKIVVAIILILACALAIISLSPFLETKADNVYISAEFHPEEIQSGQSTMLKIKVENQKNEEYAPVVRIRAEKNQDNQYLEFAQNEWELYPMKYVGEVQINEINVTAFSPASESRFNVIVSLEENEMPIFSKKIALVVVRE